MQDASRASLRLLAAADDGEPRRCGWSSPPRSTTVAVTARPELDRAVIAVRRTRSPGPAVAAVHVDGADAEPAPCGRPRR